MVSPHPSLQVGACHHAPAIPRLCHGFGDVVAGCFLGSVTGQATGGELCTAATTAEGGTAAGRTALMARRTLLRMTITMSLLEVGYKSSLAGLLLSFWGRRRRRRRRRAGGGGLLDGELDGRRVEDVTALDSSVGEVDLGVADERDDGFRAQLDLLTVFVQRRQLHDDRWVDRPSVLFSKPRHASSHRLLHDLEFVPVRGRREKVCACAMSLRMRQHATPYCQPGVPPHLSGPIVNRASADMDWTVGVGK